MAGPDFITLYDSMHPRQISLTARKRTTAEGINLKLTHRNPSRAHLTITIMLDPADIEALKEYLDRV